MEDRRWRTMRFRFLDFLLFLALVLPGSISAQSDTNSFSRPPTNRKSKIENRKSSAPPVPLPYTNSSPVALFRELLSMSGPECAQRLADRPPGNRRLIKDKLAQYKMLNPNERALRLSATELWWYLFPLMNQGATNRDEQIKALPADLQQSVRDRIQEWDKVPPAVQKEFLENFDVLRHLADQQANATNGITPARQVQLEIGVRRFQGLPEPERKQLLDRFTQFFDLTPGEKDKALKSLSEVERRQIEKTLQAFRNLDAAQRAQCMRSFQAFASLSPVERQRFLKNADRWQHLTPADRQKLRELLQQAPLSPVVRNFLTPAPLPILTPTPRGPKGTGPGTLLVTNRN